MRSSVACVALTLLVSACGSRSAHREDSVDRAASPLTVPGGCPIIAFDVNAPDRSWIALTFDDGPEDTGTTLEVLDILRSEGVRATFFINTSDSIDVLSSSSGRLAVQRMVEEGHQVGNHTVHHYNLGESSTDVKSEVFGVADVLREVAPSALEVRLFRAPFGDPYFGPQDPLDEVAPIVARYGVHVGWNIDSKDWGCSSASYPAACVKKNVLDRVDAGRSGIVLLHSTKRATVSALPDLIAALRARGKTFVGVEELVVAKYGKPSRRLFRCANSSECWGGDVCGADNRCGPAMASGGGVIEDSGVETTGERNRQPFIPTTREGAPVQTASSPPEVTSEAGCTYGASGTPASSSLLLVTALFVLRRSATCCYAPSSNTRRRRRDDD